MKQKNRHKHREKIARKDLYVISLI